LAMRWRLELSITLPAQPLPVGHGRLTEVLLQPVQQGVVAHEGLEQVFLPGRRLEEVGGVGRSDHMGGGGAVGEARLAVGGQHGVDQGVLGRAHGPAGEVQVAHQGGGGQEAVRGEGPHDAPRVAGGGLQVEDAAALGLTGIGAGRHLLDVDHP
jgi:hypothetical protein